WITVANPSLSATSIPDICTQGLGSVTAVPGTNSPPPYTFSWPGLASSLQTVNNVTAGTYTVFMTDGNGCTANTTVTVGDTPAQFSATTTLVSCPGGTNGTATATMTPALGTVTYLWSDGQTTQTATNLAAGTYTCVVTSSIGCSGTVTATVTEIPAMIITIANQTDVTCNSGSDGTATLNVIQGTAPYTYNWDISNSTAISANDLNANIHTVSITDANNCLQTIQITIDEPDPLSITFLTPDSMICPEATINLIAQGSGGSSPYIFTWSENGQQVGVGASIPVNPANSNTQYCVVLSEQCGSPTTQDCLTITFPTPIIPNAVPDKPKDCVPGEFLFTNTSTNPTEIATSQFIFTNGESFVMNGTESLFNDFPNVGVFSLDLIVTSYYGCVYSNTINNIVEVTPLPTADFTVSKNPATWFETTIQTSDISQGNIAIWNWSSPGSTSITTTGPNAILNYPEGVTGIYPITLTVTTTEGCSDSITLEIEIVPDILIYAPNAFTPDDDEHNQNWFLIIDGIDFENFHLEIFNRWGEKIWESYDASVAWDGTYKGLGVPNGTYNWKVSYKMKDNDNKDFKTGFVNVLR
ncbi:MAG: gliding motility-associated C-terminal domain-containing protein, partial [Crocinitomicaceae bacterium]